MQKYDNVLIRDTISFSSYHKTLYIHSINLIHLNINCFTEYFCIIATFTTQKNFIIFIRCFTDVYLVCYKQYICYTMNKVSVAKQIRYIVCACYIGLTLLVCLYDIDFIFIDESFYS